jgi:hypothetical protein
MPRTLTGRGRWLIRRWWPAPGGPGVRRPPRGAVRRRFARPRSTAASASNPRTSRAPALRTARAGPRSTAKRVMSPADRPRRFEAKNALNRTGACRRVRERAGSSSGRPRSRMATAALSCWPATEHELLVRAAGVSSLVFPTTEGNHTGYPGRRGVRRSPTRHAGLSLRRTWHQPRPGGWGGRPGAGSTAAAGRRRGPGRRRR